LKEKSRNNKKKKEIDFSREIFSKLHKREKTQLSDGNITRITKATLSVEQNCAELQVIISITFALIRLAAALESNEIFLLVSIGDASPAHDCERVNAESTALLTRPIA
jgi:hypothetical protein